MIRRIHDRATFVVLREQGRRARRGPVAVVYVPDRGAETSTRWPRVAFAITRRAGSAVDRNRIRRRVRAALVDLDQRSGSPLVAGAYLVSADHRAVDLPFRELSAFLEAAILAATAGSRPAGSSA